MLAIFLAAAITSGTAEASITVTHIYKTPGHRHHQRCLHKPDPHPEGKWVWVPGNVYKHVRWGRIRYHQGPGKWKLVPHVKTQ